jgi:hypothetical protein
MDCLLKIALTGCYDTEGDAGFGESHGARSMPSKSVLAAMTSLASGLRGGVSARAAARLVAGRAAQP